VQTNAASQAVLHRQIALRDGTRHLALALAQFMRQLVGRRRFESQFRECQVD
jgi:hypothetical protein